MRQLIICTMVFLITVTSFCQQTGSQSSFTKQDYLEKSKKQKKTGMTLLAAGGVLMATALIIPKGELVYDGICVGPFCDDKYKNDGVKSAIGITGALAALGSIPFFKLSKKNGQRAASVSLKINNALQLTGQRFTSASFPALLVKMNF